MQPSHIQINPADTVAVALRPLAKGDQPDGLALVLLDDVPRGHKFALRDHAEGEPVLKYGASIGLARMPIATGAHVHVHNLRTGLDGKDEYAYAGVPQAPATAPGSQEVPQIMAFERVDGNIGIRNDLWIIPLVGCVNRLAERMARQFESRNRLPEGTRVMVLNHPYGCSQLGDDLDTTRAILQNLAAHPNAGGVLILGLGCENNTRAFFEEGLAHPDPRRVRAMSAQESEDEYETALAHLEDLAAIVRTDERVSVGADRLRIGLKCGGSDGFSGITANPLLGAFSDWLCDIGGATVLTEVPEMFGAERILMARAKDQSVFQDTVALVNDFKQYYIDHDQPIYENPSPGNKAGGISTLEEKSLGCTQKAGRALVRDVLRYTERARSKGLSLLESPGNDGVSITALAATGCHIVLFTTGRGTPMGSVVPTLKIASNSDLAQRKPHWIDFNAGPIATGEATLLDLRDDFIAKILATASGVQARNEENGMSEITIFKSGVTL